MKTIVLASLVCSSFLLAACGGGGSPAHDLASGNSTGDMSKTGEGDMTLVYDLAGDDLSSHAPPGGDLSACMAPTGASCPTTAGNCLGIGTPCGSCPAGLICEMSICVSIFACTPGMHQCGTGASCCNTATTEHVSVCLPNVCIPSDCTAE